MPINYARYRDLSTQSQSESRGGDEEERVVPALTVVVHPDPERVGDLFVWPAAGRTVRLSRTTPLFAPRHTALGHGLGHPALSRTPLILETCAEGLMLHRADHRGKVWVDGTPLGESRLLRHADLERGVAVDLARRVLLWVHPCRPSLAVTDDTMNMVGMSDAMVRLRTELARLADLDATVLIRGATGTGKELVARALHGCSRRARAPFVGVNMAGLSESLATSELFGAVRGAYSGADKDRKGYLAAAHEGVLFLDEIGDTPPAVQTMLLRVLETREVVPVGAHRGIPVDIRLISATDADLEEAVVQGRFRAPLLHRVAVCEVHLPPLEARLEDLGPLLMHFAAAARTELGLGRLPLPDGPMGRPWIPTELAQRLLQFSWPGNIRQCRNVVGELVIAAGDGAHLHATERLNRLLEPAATPGSVEQASAAPAPTPARKPGDLDEATLTAALAARDWVPRLAAGDLGISRASIYKLIAKYPNLRTAADLTPEELRTTHAACNGDLQTMAATLRVSAEGLGRALTKHGIVKRG